MAKRFFVRYPDQATDGLLARGEVAVKESADVVRMLDKASRRLTEAIQQCDEHLARANGNGSRRDRE